MSEQSESSAEKILRPAIFLDRDGVLNSCEPGKYVNSWADFYWINGARRAIKIFNDLGYLVIVVTNQGGIAWGFTTREKVEDIHRRMNLDLRFDDAKIDAFYYCPHHPKGKIPEFSIECNSRKPNPGMILQAIKERSIDPNQSIMIGDMESDLQAGTAAGLGGSVLIKSGDGLGPILHDFAEAFRERQNLLRVRE